VSRYLPALSVYWHTEEHYVSVAQQCADIAMLSNMLGPDALIEGIDHSDKTWRLNTTGCRGRFTSTSPATNSARLKTTDGEASASAARRITVWWKPSNVSTIRADVAGMKRTLSATGVMIYCGFAPRRNGTFGSVGSSGGSWGDPVLCRPAVVEARRAGLSVQLVVEGRFDEPNIGAALARGGAAFGGDVLRVLAQLGLPLGPDGVTGLNFDWEPGRNHSGAPSEAVAAAWTAALAQSVWRVNMTVTVDAQPYVFTPWHNLSYTLTVGGVHGIYAMGLYHGLSNSEWTSKLMDAVHSVGDTAVAQSASTFAVAMQIGENKFAWENSSASVIERFAAIRKTGIRHVGVFAWARGDVSGGNQRPPARMLEIWRAQLSSFASGT
jgi:hypothetical protein